MPTDRMKTCDFAARCQKFVDGLKIPGKSNHETNNSMFNRQSVACLLNILFCMTK
jgi:hypothetical protein